MQVLVLGSGQLARMLSLDGAPLNINVQAYEHHTQQILHPLTLSPSSLTLEQAISQADVITSEFEHIPHDVLAICKASGKFYQLDRAIKVGGDRALEKQLLEKCGIKNTHHRVFNTKSAYEDAVAALGIPLVLKSTLAGYDGKGQWRLKDSADIANTWNEIETFLAQAEAGENAAILAEEFISFDREVSIIGARNAKGEIETYPLTENHHTNGVLSFSVPKPESQALQAQAKEIFEKLVTELDYVGVLAIEFFDCKGELLVNEIAPRVHNSGHWTQQGATTSQFENHLRAVCSLPLGSTEILRPSAMINILGTDALPLTLLTMDEVHQHWYGKAPRKGRKMGHINVTATDFASLRERLKEVISHLPAEHFPELEQIIEKALA